MLKVGITGGIASGKSAVCKIFEVIGIPVYSADKRAKTLIFENPEIRKEIVLLLGDKAYRKDGSYDTTFVSSIVFSDPLKLQALNEIVHPRVREDYMLWHDLQEAPYTLHEAALIIESGFHAMMDKLIVVTAPEDIRIKRIIYRDGISEEEAMGRIISQMPDDEKLKYSDYVVNNNGQFSIVEQCLIIHSALLSV